MPLKRIWKKDSNDSTCMMDFYILFDWIFGRMEAEVAKRAGCADPNLCLVLIVMMLCSI